MNYITVYVGMDVHKDSFFVFYLGNDDSKLCSIKLKNPIISK